MPVLRVRWLAGRHCAAQSVLHIERMKRQRVLFVPLPIGALFGLISFLTMSHDHMFAILGGGDVMPTDEIRAEFATLLDRVERDAFQRGWDAALKRVMAAAANAPHVEAAPCRRRLLARNGGLVTGSCQHS